MKNRVKKMLKNPMLIIFILILIFFTPQALISPGQNRDRGVVIAIGIDQLESEYEISLLTFIPTAQNSYKELTSVISGKGDTIAKALYNAQITMGRDIGLSHAKTTVVNEKLLEEDVAEYIDYLSRVTSLSENTVFICTNSSAKELLEASSALETSVGLQLEQIIGYNAKNLYVTDTSLEAFYKGYYSESKSSLIGYISLTSEDPDASTATQTGAEQTDAEGGGSSEGGSGKQDGQQSKQIKNDGQAVLIKNGKKQQILSVDELNGINLLNIESLNQIITINDVNYKDNKLRYSFRIKNKRINKVSTFENGYPVYGAQLILGLELVEIDGPHENLKINTEFSELTPEIVKKLDDELKTQFTSALKILRKNKTDVIGINETFFKENRKEYNRFIKTIGGPENFLEYVNFKINFILESD